ncbi:MFS transporter [Bacillus sp. V33-4]|uniref:MFS transporter n=1 Tax=Bacillus sp. V33-4 TaxID=2054169 RepID=UPI000C77F209|nr:MFS transporter [Bacillus sp. V33-4]PLR84814.1 MFS transporter [Bacillus sp. V33-4]
MKHRSLFAPLRNRHFRYLFAGQVVSDIGNWFSFLAIGILLAYRWQLSPVEIALFPIAMSLPWIVFSPFSGVWADLLPKKRLLIICDLLRAIIVTGYIFAPNLIVILTLVILNGIVSTLFDPARQGAIRFIVPKEHLLQANSLSQLSVHTSKILAPTLGGIIVTTFSPNIAFITNALCYLISAFFLLGLPRMNISATKAKLNPISFWKDFQDGWRHILTKRNLILGMGFMFVGTFLVFLFDSFLALWAKDMGLSESSFGILIGSIGLGSVIGAIIIGKLGQKIHPLRLMFLAAILVGSLIAVAGIGELGYLPKSIILWIVVWFSVGFIGSGYSISFGYILQIETPQDLMGRIYGTSQGIQSIPILIAPLIGAFLIENLGTGGLFLFAGGVTTLITSFVFIFVRVDTIDEEEQNSSLESEKEHSRSF